MYPKYFFKIYPDSISKVFFRYSFRVSEIKSSVFSQKTRIREKTVLNHRFLEILNLSGLFDFSKSFDFSKIFDFSKNLIPQKI